MHSLNSTIHSRLRGCLRLAGLVLAFAALGPAVRAVTPAPDGGYPGFNTAEGDYAMYSLTTGQHNTGIGFEALYSNYTGWENTATGYLALYANQSGNDNTATGAYALYSNLVSENTATGAYAMFTNQYGLHNTAFGFKALYFSDGNDNVALGWEALFNNRSGGGNTATGKEALAANTTGFNNTATGIRALTSATTASANTALGAGSLLSDTTGQNNTAAGTNALFHTTTGNNNVAVGTNAGQNLTTGSNNIDIGANVLGAAGEANTIRIGKSGTQTRTFVAGIYGKTLASGVGVVINSAGQLGTVQSSARYKEAIKPMGDSSKALLQLKPVTFRYKEELDPEKIPQFGLIAEEVEKINPDLVVRDEEGQVTTVRYEAVNAMLLNEFLAADDEARQFKATMLKQQEEFERKIAEQQSQIATLTAGLHKISAQAEVRPPVLRTAAK